MSSGITRDDWLTALHEAGISCEHDDTATTIDEYAAMFHICRATARNQLDRLVETGVAVATHKRLPRRDGRVVSFRAYRIARS
jgi:predicted ArsR family transcriptional regulator